MTLPYSLTEPAGAALPLVVDSPHSGLLHAETLPLAAPPEALLSGWDAYVDQLFAHAPRVGGTLLCADFPRWLVDVNRARDDIDPDLIDGAMPYDVRPSDKSGRGMGVLRRLALPGVPVYAATLSPHMAEYLLKTYYDPYHAALSGLLAQHHARCGAVWHLDCHSMKSRGNAMNVDNGAARPDFVVSNGDGATCSAAFIELVSECLRSLGYHVAINWPYKGAQLIRAYADPAQRRHSLQIEINRALYMDEATLGQHAGFAVLRGHLDELLEHVAAYIQTELRQTELRHTELRR
ncbi:N-formylglutamate amidohydrolase [Cupriavidus taiwanensis]|uniref:N-formylglutamate amidohydrolase n=1 Tax=Cupriavidus taiwanensis TaxID=164546 RepID=A0A9Q7XPD3_9BURK|nr:N-formylglutamate amidohydrolase [Cupriavidus taiwanensis]SPD64204.1 N-formylglutamate amidohydrolase [Cupriavidus taiwanensis]